MMDAKARARFFSKLKLNTLSGCMEWQGGLNERGYGQFSVGRSNFKAHRVAAYLAGMLPTISAKAGSCGDDLVLHKCDNEKCCNPDHLFVGNHQNNMDDALDKGRLVTHLSDDQVCGMRELYATGEYSISRLGFIFKADIKVVKDLLFGLYRTRAGGPIAKVMKRVNPPKPDGQRALTMGQAEEVRLVIAAGIYSQPEIARKLGVSQRTISDIVLNKTYRKSSTT